MIDQQTQRCSVCALRWPLDMFPRSLTLASGVSRQCRDCNHIRSVLWVQGISPCPNDVVRLIVRAFHVGHEDAAAVERAAMVESIRNA